MVRQIRFTFALPESTIEVDGEVKPRVIGKTYTFSLYELSNLYKDLTSWFGVEPTKEFDFKDCLGKTAELQVVHKPRRDDPSKSYAKINAIMEYDGEVVYDGDLVLFDLNEFDKTAFEMLPKFMQDIIFDSPEYANVDPALIM